VAVGAVENQCPRPLRVGCSEQDAHGAAFGNAKQGGGPAADRVHDGAHVIHPLFEGWHRRAAIGQTGAALVKKDQAAEGAKAREEACAVGFVPNDIEIRDESRNKHQIERAAPHDLICNTDVATLCVMRLRQHGVPRTSAQSAPISFLSEDG
jgi:hypothetical protein